MEESVFVWPAEEVFENGTTIADPCVGFAGVDELLCTATGAKTNGCRSQDAFLQVRITTDFYVTPSIYYVPSAEKVATGHASSPFSTRVSIHPSWSCHRAEYSPLDAKY